MLIRNADPFREFDRLTQQLMGTTARPVAMPIDAYRKDEMFYVHLDLPGVRPDDVDITVERNVLTVTASRHVDRTEGDEIIVGERPHGEFRRQLFLGEQLDTENIGAEYDNGVLTLTLSVAEQAKPRKVEIAKGSKHKEIAGSTA